MFVNSEWKKIVGDSNVS